MRKPFYFTQKKAWYVRIDGKLVRLDQDKQKAEDKYHALMATDEINASVAVVYLIDAAIEWMKTNRAGKTTKWYQDHLQSFTNSIGGGLLISELKPHHVTKWLDKQAWSDNTKHRAVAAVQRVFNWARKQGYIVRSPLEGMEKPEASPRDVLVSEEHFKEAVAKTPDQAGKDFWTFLWETGCRVQEAKMVSTEHFHEAERRLVIPKKRAKGKKKARVIYLNDVALEIVTRRIKEQGPGLILRNRRKKPWTKEAIKSRTARFLKPLNDTYCAAAFRHTFCTRALLSGIDPITVAELMGHSNLNMVANNYQHLCKKPLFLLEQLNKLK